MGIVKGIIEFVMEILETIVFIGTLFIVVYLYILQPNQVKGASMEPSFISGDYIFTSKVTYKMRTPVRGDVIVFDSPKNPEIEYIKRVIALAGDKIKITDGVVQVNNRVLDEKYISAKTPLWDSGFIKNGVEYQIPSGMLFVMGDNRPRSSDSREFGPISSSAIIGQVFYRYFPSSKMGAVNNPWPKNLQVLDERLRLLAIRIASLTPLANPSALLTRS